MLNGSKYGGYVLALAFAVGGDQRDLSLRIYSS